MYDTVFISLGINRFQYKKLILLSAERYGHDIIKMIGLNEANGCTTSID